MPGAGNPGENKEGTMPVVDTHCHTGRYWYEPVETLLFQMERNGVDRAVLIQFRGNFDNEYELEAVRQHPDRLAAVVMVDVDRADAGDTLARWAESGAAGVRLYASDRSPGDDPLAIWRRAGQLGLPVSCLGSVEEFASADFRSLVQALPEVRIIIEHLAGVKPEMDDDLFRQAMGLGAFPNTYIKLPGLGEVLPRPFPFREPPFGALPEALRLAFDAFGSHRMMWWSDFPPSASREGYGNALRLPRERIDFFSDEDREWAFGGTAMTVFRFG